MSYYGYYGGSRGASLVMFIVMGILVGAVLGLFVYYAQSTSTAMLNATRTIAWIPWELRNQTPSNYVDVKVNTTTVTLPEPASPELRQAARVAGGIGGAVLTVLSNKKLLALAVALTLIAIALAYRP